MQNKTYEQPMLSQTKLLYDNNTNQEGILICSLDFFVIVDLGVIWDSLVRLVNLSSQKILSYDLTLIKWSNGPNMVMVFSSVLVSVGLTEGYSRSH